MSHTKLLLIDLTRLEGSAATSTLKQSIFGSWPSHCFAHLRPHGQGGCGIKFGLESGAREEKFSMGDPLLIDAAKKYQPDVILYRPVADNDFFHSCAMKIIEASRAPLALWLMDDWPARLKFEDADRYVRYDSDLRWLFQRSYANFAISPGMASEFGARYDVRFDVIHNGVDPAQWPQRRRPLNDEKVIVRYAGSLAPDTTKDSILTIARLVSRLSENDVPVSFEGQTQRVWLDRYGDLFKGLPGVTLRAAELPMEEYRQWLCDSDIVLVGYNFDAETRRYLKYSFANKIPETLASGAAVFAYGPDELQTIIYLNDHDIAYVVSKPDAALVEAGLTKLIEDKTMRASLGRRAREHAFDHFNLAKQKGTMTSALQNISHKWSPPKSSVEKALKAQFDECQFVYHVLDAKRRQGTMIDVGAHVGSSLINYAKAGWSIYAFEPDPGNRKTLNSHVAGYENVEVFDKAVGKEARSNVAFYSSDVSTGISGLTAFHESHKETARIDTTTLNDLIQSRAIEAVDFLKIDVEGHEMDVLAGLDFEKIKPKAIVAEFEDGKTQHHGYSMKDLASYLQDAGYVVFVSEWHPIERYGVKHSWKQLLRYPCQTLPDSWGNLVAFTFEPDSENLDKAYQESLSIEQEKLRKNEAMLDKTSLDGAFPTRSAGVRPRDGRSLYVRAAEYLVLRHPVVARILRFGVWSLRKIRRRIVGVGGVLLLVLLSIAVGGFVRPDIWPIWLGLAAVSAIFFGGFFVLGYVAEALARRDVANNARFQALQKQMLPFDRRLEKASSNLERLERRIINFERLELEKINANAEELGGLKSRTLHLEQLVQENINQSQIRDRQFSRMKNKQQAVNEAYSTKLHELTINTRAASRKADNIERMGQSNASLARVHTRQLSDADLVEFGSVLAPALGVEYSRSRFGYLAHKISLTEDIVAGRLAAPTTTMLLRLLASHSLSGERIDILEIGTLFGVGAACLHQLHAPHDRKVCLTLIDPMEGYYEHGALDPITGAPVTEAMLRNNLRLLEVPDDDWRLIKKLSTDPEAYTAASDRSYDMLIIDGDHTLEGVTRDFEIFSDLVRPGGLLIFDDYDTEDWPDIKPYVDDLVQSSEAWSWICGAFRTAIIKRNM